jgi:hypothetical protein
MSKKEALATYLGWDYADLCLYQPHNWNHPIVTCDNEWYTATTGKCRPTLRSKTGITIVDLEKVAEIGGKTIWRHQP